MTQSDPTRFTVPKLSRIPNCEEQAARLQIAASTQSHVVAVNRYHMIWRTNLRPTALNGNYLVQISYWLGTAPETRVLCPDLKTYKDQSLPHVYSDTELCLYYPKANPPEWTPDMWLSDTIYRWAALWLMFYENWLVTGDWDGGGIDHSPKATSTNQ